MLLFSFSFGLQPMRAGGSSGRDQAPSPADAFDSKVLSPSRRSCQCAEYSLRISDLESRLTLAKRQTHMAMNKASKSCGFMKQISILEDKVLGLMAKIVHLEECDSFLIGIVEFICEMLRSKIPCVFSYFLFIPLLSSNILCCLRYLSGLCC
jgi:hypothetical protein